MFCLPSFPALGSGLRAAAPELFCSWREKCAGLISPWAACCEPPVLRGCPQSWRGMGGPARALLSSQLTGDGQNTGTNRLRGAAFASARQEAAATFAPFPGLVVWWQPQLAVLVEGPWSCGCRGVLAPTHITPRLAGSSPCPVRFLCFTW